MSPVIQVQILTGIISALVTFIYCSVFEWWLHKYVLHQRLGPLKQGWERHVMVHHAKYAASLRAEKDHFEHVPGSTKKGESKDIALQWYTLPILLGIHVPLVWAFQYASKLPVFLGSVGMMLLYFAVYEFFHFRMHAPKHDWVERMWVFRYVRRRHHKHHRGQKTNFCVLFPLADWVFGTNARTP